VVASERGRRSPVLQARHMIIFNVEQGNEHGTFKPGELFTLKLSERHPQAVVGEWG
jgi:hypothetical protein